MRISDWSSDVCSSDLIEKPSSMEPDAMDGWYYCDGVLLGVTKPYGRGGQRLDYWRPDHGLIPPGLIYVGSLHPSGFDSRYYGPVPTARLTHTERRPASALPSSRGTPDERGDGTECA